MNCAQGEGDGERVVVLRAGSVRGADEAAGESLAANLANLANFSGTGGEEFFTRTRE
jgi:hypothetical protein